MLPLTFLSKIFVSKTGLYMGIALAVLIGLYSWHTSVVRQAQQSAKEEITSQQFQTQSQQYQTQQKNLQDQISQLNDTIASLSKQKIQSTIVVQKDQTAGTVAIQAVDKETQNDVINDICKRILCK